ncbi:MAG: ATP-binding cassette domain-containing protein, partial [Eubacteriales bacterium]|nr:ATP-binding cassette domain-containing protein [Eubacteriales bacterium]
GWNTKDDDHIWDIRQTAGMVFQNPDNQLVAALVEDDVAFGPENLGVESGEIARRVDEVLHAVGMEDCRKKASHQLSGGQKQRIAVAGVIAMNPKCVIFDEPTAMLDPQGRKEIMDLIHTLHEAGRTIILITHFMEEAADADRIIMMNDGEIILEGTPVEVFAHPAKIKQAGLDVPVAVELAERLRGKGWRIPQDVITSEQLVDFVCQYK